jgi:hypothetical protein
MTDTAQSHERIVCEGCKAYQECHPVRKPKRVRGFIYFPLVWLCLVCRYTVEIIEG